MAKLSLKAKSYGGGVTAYSFRKAMQRILYGYREANKRLNAGDREAAPVSQQSQGA